MALPLPLLLVFAAVISATDPSSTNGADVATLSSNVAVSGLRVPWVNVTVETPSEDGSPCELSVDSITKTTCRQVFVVSNVIVFSSQHECPKQ